MAKVSITLTDVDGAVESQVAMDTDFDTNSNAHQVAALLLKHMDELMQRVEDDLTPMQKSMGQFPTIESQLLVVDR